MSSPQNDLFAELWIKQSKILLKATSSFTIAEAAVITACFGLWKTTDNLLGMFVALVGMFLSALGLVYLYRTVEYVQFFRGKLDVAFKGMRPPFLRLSGREACLTVPPLGFVLNSIIAFAFWWRL